MKLFYPILEIGAPVLGVLFLSALILKWCGKADTVAEGFRIALDGIISLFKDDSYVAQVCYEIEEREFDSFTKIIQVFFEFAVFISAQNCGDYMVVRYRVGGMNVPIDVLEVEWVKFIKRIYNVPVHIKIPVFVYFNDIDGYVDFYCAFNDNGMKKIRMFKDNIKSRQLPHGNRDIEE